MMKRLHNSITGLSIVLILIAGKTFAQVTYSSFTASCTNGLITWNWQTSSETNNDYFIIEGTYDTVNQAFYPVDSIDGAGTSTTLQNYQDTLSGFSGTTSYWRLSQVNFNGNSASTYSYIVEVTCAPSSSTGTLVATFTGNCSNGMVTLEWSTSVETNNDYFTIERSPDGINFTDIAKIDGAGNSTQTLNYQHIDSAALDTAYYRLKQTDFNGASSYSNVIVIYCSTSAGIGINEDKKNSSILVYPNPGAGQFHFSNLERASQIEIMDITGQIIYEVQSNENSITVNIENAAKGIYFYKISGKNQTVKQGKLINN